MNSLLKGPSPVCNDKRSVEVGVWTGRSKRRVDDKSRPKSRLKWGCATSGDIGDVAGHNEVEVGGEVREKEDER